MAIYFELGCDKKINCYTFHEKLGDSEWDRINVWSVVSLLDTYPCLTLQAYKNQPIPDYFKVGPRPIVSDRLRQIFEDFHVAAEFIPIKVVDNDGKPVLDGPYWFLHMLEEVQCIDVANSIIERFDEDTKSPLKRIDKLVFIDAAIESRHLFRPEGMVLLFVSEELKSAILKKKVKGPKFTPLDAVWM